MDRFPNELMPKLFGYLRLKDLIRCRLVNHRFKYFADSAKFDELVVASRPTPVQKKCWFVTKEMVNIEERAISPNSLNGCRFVFRRLNRQLKRLVLNFEHELPLNMAIFDNFPIEQLDLACLNLGSNQAVVLPCLRILELKIDFFVLFYFGKYTFFLRAPNLTKM